jgi:hypothetical protein
LNLSIVPQLVDMSIDPVNVPRDLGVNSRVWWPGAGLDRPGYNSDLLAVDEQGAAGVTLNLEIM